MTRDDWKYLAGLFDGEGCVTVTLTTRKTSSRSGKAGNRYLNTSLRISNNDPRVLLWLEDNFGGVVRAHGTRDSWVWTVQGDKSLEAAKQLAKYSRMKRDQLENYIALCRLKKTGRVTEAEWKQREKLVKAIRSAEYRRKDGKNQHSALRLIS